MNFIVVLEPSWQQSDYGLSIRQDRQPSMIAFEGFDECLRDAVGFRRADWRETQLEAQAVAMSSVSLAMYAEPFNLKPWKPGQSGNLNCRPVGPRQYSTRPRSNPQSSSLPVRGYYRTSAGDGRTVPARQSIDRGWGNTPTGALRYAENHV